MRGRIMETSRSTHETAAQFRNGSLSACSAKLAMRIVAAALSLSLEGVDCQAGAPNALDLQQMEAHESTLNDRQAPEGLCPR